MKKIALFSVVALSSAVAIGAEENSSEPSAAKQNAPCCAADKDAADDECWLDVETITVEAANGDPIAQYTIAWLTDTGMNNVQQDTEKAKGMYAEALPGLEKAAAAGDPAACCALANMYANGKGVEKDEAKAKELMQRCKELIKAQKEQKK
ncbi:MAG: hypothetical protein E7031_06135 [Akkermansiaceae bacterium]|nr:hypothetical protein [Akkermansiaceae bacterium]